MRASSVRATAFVARPDQAADDKPQVDTTTSGVRERSPTSETHREPQALVERPAHPSDGLVAQLNESWRIVDDPLQWILQRKKGRVRKRNTGWQSCKFLTTREGLLRRIREKCGDVDPAALATISALPDDHSDLKGGSATDPD